MLSFFKELWRGKDLYRVLMNECCRTHEIQGLVVDIGSGKTLASYHRFLRRAANARIECIDLGFHEKGNVGQKVVDIEEAPLPYTPGSVDTALLFNVLEHVSHPEKVLSDVFRILQTEGALFGAVPFLVQYHPDPHDYWRYTTETLGRLFREAGFLKVEIMPFGRGPWSAGFSQVEHVLPKIVRLLCVPCIFFLDRIVVRCRPALGVQRFPLGYFFVVRK